jgi:hypothetical protein
MAGAIDTMVFQGGGDGRGYRNEWGAHLKEGLSQKLGTGNQERAISKTRHRKTYYITTCAKTSNLSQKNVGTSGAVPQALWWLVLGSFIRFGALVYRSPLYRLGSF